MKKIQPKPTSNANIQTETEDKRLFFLVNMARHHIYNYVDAECHAQLGISVTQAGALLFIAKHEGCYQKSLGNALGLKKPAVTGLVSRMEKNDLILRKACKQDRRASTLFLSDAGKNKIPQIMPLIQKSNDEFLSDFTDTEKAMIFKFLNKIILRFS